MTTFLLIRHGLNDWVDKAIAGWTPGVHLNVAGQAQAVHLSERLAQAPIAALYSSPLERARETAQPLAERLGLEIRLCEDFGEIRFGDWTGKALNDLAADPRWQQFNALRSLTRAPGGESMLEVQARTIRALEVLRRQHPNEMIAVVSHGDTIKSALLYLLGLPMDFYSRFDISPASVSVVAVDEHSPRLLRLNDTGKPLR